MSNNLLKLDFVVKSYENLENQVLEIMDYVPFINQNRTAVSPKFVSIILESCSLVESIFREITDDGKIGSYNLNKYAAIHNEQLNLGETISIFIATPIGFYMPFADWTKKPPTWWNVYNSLKHDRLNNYQLVTYESVILSLCALHQLISRCTIFTNHLISAGWFNESSEFIPELIVARISESGMPLGIIPCETRLFISPLSENFAYWHEDRHIIKTEECEFSSRVRNILTMEGYF